MIMLKQVKKWFNKRITLIFAPGEGSRSFQVRVSYPFITFLILTTIGIFVAGAYMSDIYANYLYAVKKNKKLVTQNSDYSQQIETSLDMISNVKKIEVQLRGLLGMRTARNIVEKYPMGGAFSEDSELFSSDFNSIDQQSRFNSHVGVKK
jgi:hypothetical protein